MRVPALRLGRVRRLAGVALMAAGLILAGSGAAISDTDRIPLGPRGLPESISTTTVAPGVTLTAITRGSATSRGNRWNIHVLTIDPRLATGTLRSTFGPSLAQTETTSELTRAAGAVAGVNASFFAFGRSPSYPGMPVGLSLFGGRVLSEPTSIRGEGAFVFDSVSKKVLLGALQWRAELTNRVTGAALALEILNHPPVIPPDCLAMADQRRCRRSGDLVAFSPDFGPRTPNGRGVEVVLDSAGCVVRSAAVRGTALLPGQSSLQATGRSSVELLALTTGGCLTRTDAVSDDRGRTLILTPTVYAVSGRFALLSRGLNVVPSGNGSMFARHPRTFAGVTTDGRIMLVTVDGRQSTSVGTTLNETAKLARALGLRDAINLDGGGSTTMWVLGALVNRPSDGRERRVGDALIYVP
ncbi:MAG: phosphodiester glycosidase family protein [Sporichthyaceae bacterium]